MKLNHLQVAYLIVFLAVGMMLSTSATAQVTCNMTVSNAASICPGDSVQLSAISAPDTLDFRYFWQPAGSLSDTSISNPVARPTTTTTYVVTSTTVDSTELVFNGNFELGDTGFISDYIDSISVWNPGTYNVSTSAQNVHPGFTNCPDNTGGGNFMVINGSSIPNEIVWSQTIPIQPFTEYEFSAWLTNVVPTFNLPILQFSINGQLLDQPFTSAPDVCLWSQFFTIWTSDTATTALIEIVNQSVQPIGNDLGLDDISFRAVCRSIDSVTVTVYEPYDPAVYGLGEDQLICDANPVTLATTVPGATNHVWQDGDTSETYSASLAGTYSVALLDGNGCEFSDSMNITEGQSPQITLPADTTICSDNVVVFNVYDPSATSYQWRGPSVYYLQNNPTDSVFTATFEGVYEVDITNNCGTLTQRVELFTEDCVCLPFVPNAFSPNNDGDNDVLQVFAGCDVTDVQFSIFNRWGERVFFSNDINSGWDGIIDGQIAPIGVYVYKLEYTAANFKGENVPNVRYGDISLVR